MARQVSETERLWRASSNIITPSIPAAEDAALVKEWRRDMSVPIQRYYKINNKEGQIIPFKLKRGQRAVWLLVNRMLQANRPIRIIVLKSRKIGISTLIAAILFTVIRLWPRSESYIISFQKESAKKIFKMCKLFYDTLPEWMRPPLAGFQKDSLLELGNPDPQTRREFPGLQSLISIGTAKSPNIGRGGDVRFAMCTETAFWENPVKSLDAVLNAVPSLPFSFVFSESTSAGEGGHFHETFRHFAELSRQYKAGEIDSPPEWETIFLPAWLDEEYEDALTPAEEERVVNDYDEYEKSLVKKYTVSTADLSLPWWKRSRVTPQHISWRRRVRSEKYRGSQILMFRSYPETSDEAFVGKGLSIFSREALEYIKQFLRHGEKGRLYNASPDPNVIRPWWEPEPEFHEDEDEYPLTRWEAPVPGETYFGGCDSALGVQHDSDAIVTEQDDSENEGDYCCAVVWNSKLVQVAEYHRRVINPSNFGAELALLGAYYNNCYLMPEMNPGGGGMGTINKLRELHYPNIGRWEHPDYPTKKTKESLGWEINSRALSYSTKVLTGGGWVNNGNLRVGEMVRGFDGWTKILGIYDVGVRDLFRVRFSDGSWIETTDDHYWRVTSEGRLFTTAEIAADLHGDGCRWEIPMVPAVIDERVAFLQDIMDECGRVGRSGNLSCSTPSSRLAGKIEETVQSLGGTAVIRTVETKEPPFEIHRIALKLPVEIPPFRDEKRMARVRKHIERGTYSLPHREIVKVEPAGRAPCRCIRVEAPDGLYVAEQYIVTHNTKSRMVGELGRELERSGGPKPEGLIVGFVPPDELERPKMTIRSWGLWSELTTFSLVDGGLGASYGAYDDRVIAAYLGLVMFYQVGVNVIPENVREQERIQQAYYQDYDGEEGSSWLTA